MLFLQFSEVDECDLIGRAGVVGLFLAILIDVDVVAETDELECLLQARVVFHGPEPAIRDLDAGSHFHRSVPLLCLVLLISEQHSSADEVPEDHVILGQCPSFISEDISDLTQVLIDRGVIGHRHAVIRLRESQRIRGQSGPLE